MNPDAKVKMRGVQVGKVASIEIAARRQGGPAPGDGPVAAAPHSRQRARRHRVVDGVRRQVRRAGAARRTRRRSAARRPGDSRASTSRSRSTPSSSNWCRCWTRSTPRSSTRHWARSRQAFNGRGEKFGQTLTDFDSFLAKIEPSLPDLSHDLEVAADGVQRLRRRGAGPGQDRRTTRQRSARRSSTSNTTSTRSWSARSVWPTSATT